MDHKHSVGPDFDWSEERKKKASELFAAGTSAEAIGAELGCSRNAVIGKMRRMGVVSPRPRGGDGRPPDKPKAPKVAAPRPPIARPNMQTIRARSAGPSDVPVERFFAKDHVASEATRKTLLGLSANDCRFPCGNPGEDGFFFCGHPSANVATGKPYCDQHHKIAFRA